MHMMTCQILVLGQNTRGVTGGFSSDDDGTYVTAKTYCVDWYPNRKPYRPLGTPATELGGSAMAHGGARPCSGLAGPTGVVTSSPRHQHMMEKAIL